MAYQMPMQEDNLRRGPWLEEEDERLIAVVAVLGERRWDALAKASGLRRSGKSCRLRWMNYLRPNIKHGHITEEEERLIIQLHNQWGNKWSKIARRFPGRTDNEIKNYWRSHLSKKTLIQGQEFLANNVLLNNKSDKSSSSSISQCHALSPCSSNGYCISEKDDILGTISRFSDTDELSNFAFTSSPYESMLSDWICNSPAEQSKIEQHEDWYCSLLDSSFCCCPELLTVNNEISLWDSPSSIWNNVD